MVTQYKVLKSQKKLLGFGPKIKKYNKFFQKGRSAPGLEVISFMPKDYVGETHKERKQFAEEDAKRHELFYKELIENQIYPKDTKVKIKKKRHSDGYVLEMTMPKIKTPFKNDDDMWESKYSNEGDKLKSKIIDLVNKNSENDEFHPKFHEDISHSWNYGIDPETNQLAYIDLEILKDNHFISQTSTHHNYLIKRKELRKKTLENMFKTVSLFTIIIGALINGFNLTGHVISQNNFTHSFGSIITILGILGLFLTSKK